MHDGWRHTELGEHIDLLTGHPFKSNRANMTRTVFRSSGEEIFRSDGSRSMIIAGFLPRSSDHFLARASRPAIL